MSKEPEKPAAEENVKPPEVESPGPAAGKPRPKEIGGPKGPEPTRYGDWERNGRVSDF